MRKTSSLALVIALGLGVTACSTGASDDSNTVEKGGAVAIAESPTPTPTPTESATPSPSETQIPEPEFGDKYTWENEVSISISTPKAYKPSKNSSGKGRHFVSFDIVIENNSGKPIDPGDFDFSASSDGFESHDVFDYDKNIGVRPETTIKDGRSAKFKLGYGVEKPEDIIMDVTQIVPDDVNKGFSKFLDVSFVS